MRIRRFFTLLSLALLVLAAGAGIAAASGSLQGRVTAANGGAPIASAWVWVCRADNTTYTSLYTDGDGAWQTYVADGSYKVGAGMSLFLTEWYSGETDVTSADPIAVAGSPVTVDFSLADAPQGHLKGKVIDARKGTALAGLTVRAYPTVQGEGWTNSTTTAADGTYDLALSPGAYTVEYFKPGYDWVYYDGTETGTTNGGDAKTIAVTDGMLTTGLDASVPPSRTEIYGRLYDVDDYEVAGVAVQLLDAGDGHVVDSVTTDAHGEFALGLYDRAGGSYKARVHDPSGALQDQYFTYTGSTEDPASAAVITPQLGVCLGFYPVMYAPQRAHVSGHTLDAHGLPVPGVTVRLTRTPGPGGEQVVSDASGAYDISLKVAAHSGFTLAFYPGPDHPTYMGQVYNGKLPDEPGDRVSVAPGQTVTIDSSLPRRCSITGAVSPQTTSGHSIYVTLYDANGSVVKTRQAAGNGYMFTDLPEGSYRLFFHDDEGHFRDQYYDGASSLATATVVKVDAATPTRTVNVTLQPWGRISSRVYAEGTLYTPVEGATLRLYDAAGGLVTSGVADASGSCVFQQLELGTYYVGCESPNSVFLNAFYLDGTSLAEATAIEVTAAQPERYADVTLAERRGMPPEAAARPDGGWSDSTSLIATATSLAAGGDTAVAGDFWAGTARVFRHTDEGWTLEARLKPAGDGENLYGRHVAADGDTVAVSDYNETGANRDGAGKVWIYRRTAAGAWTLEQLLKPSGAAYRSFGRALALSGDTLLVGAPEVTVGDEKLAGAVYVYTRSGSTWTQRDKLTCADAHIDDSFGHAVALQGSTAVIGAPRKDWGGHNCGGEVFVFTGSGADWRQREVIKPSDGLFVMDFGEAVALDDGTIAVGCGDSPEAGAVYVYTGAGAAWSQQARLAPSDGMIGWEMGRAVALDGDTLLSPAAGGTDAPEGYAPGVGYVFRRTGAAWHQDAELRVPYRGDRRWSIGESVAVAGGDLLITAPSEPRPPNTYGWLHAFRPYVTGLGQTLVVPAGNGVLTNDSSPTGAAITAALVTAPSHGTLDLHADGSFSYTPAQGWAGDDTFTYTATDGAWTSDPATVTVTTRDPNAPNVSAEDVPKGWVNTPVTVTLSAEDDTQVREIDYRRKSSKALAWTSYDKPFTVQAQGATTYQLRALDIFGNASRTGTVTVKVDTKRPVPKVLKPVTATRGKTAVITYQIADPRPGGPTADVEIHVLKAGKEKTNFMLPGRPVGKLLTYRFRCKLPRGKYVLQVTAIDAAGNAASRPGTGTLTVK